MTGLWLLPRLSRFHTLHPGVDLRVSANNRVADLRHDGIDLAIRYAPPAHAPSGATRLFNESVAPVAHPSLGIRSLRSAQALARVSLLEFDHPSHPLLQWQEWLNALGWSEAKPQRVLRFNQYDQVIQAALGGQGVALGRLELIQPLLDDGRLVLLTSPGHRLEATHAYWLIRASEHPREDVRRVAAWIEAEAEQLRHPMA